jgi:hypothetical protein
VRTSRTRRRFRSISSSRVISPGLATLEIEVVDNVDRSKGRIIRVAVAGCYWRVGP